MNRRGFLALLALTPASAMAAPYLSLLDKVEAVTGAEWEKVNRAWKTAGLPAPEVFLKRHGMLTPGAKIDAAVRRDFSQGSTLHVDGLCLAQTEVAFVLFAKEHFS